MEDRDYKLIKLVKQYPELYNREDSNFKNKPMIENSWHMIAAIMQTTWQDCQRRWGVLRNRYAKEKRDNGTKWPLLESCTFLDVHVKTRKSPKALAASIKRNTFSEDYPVAKVGKWEEIIVEGMKLDHNGAGTLIDHKYSCIDQSDSSSSTGVVPEHESILETRNPDSSGNSFSETAHNQTVACETVSTNSEDSTMHFCLSLHEPLRKIPQKFLTKAKIEILQVLDKYENA